MRIAVIVLIGLLLGASHGCPIVSEGDAMPHTIATEFEIDDESVHLTVIMSESHTRGQDLTHAIEIWLIAPGEVRELGSTFGTEGTSRVTVSLSKERLQHLGVAENEPYLLVKHAAYEREAGAPLMEFGARVAYGEEKVFLDPTVFD